MRHAEREDRALEAQGKDWISTAPRPQDPKLSPSGILSTFLCSIVLRLVPVNGIWLNDNSS